MDRFLLIPSSHPSKAAHYLRVGEPETGHRTVVEDTHENLASMSSV